ncbi:MAG: AAA family ATPase, partial [Thermodesulfobacteriota bacterium]
DEVVEIPMPGEDDRKEIFEVHLRNKPLKNGIDPAELAARTEGFSGAEIASVCSRAALSAVRRAVATLRKESPREVKVQITRSDVDGAIAVLGGD